jgi:hypothetical protein
MRKKKNSEKVKIQGFMDKTNLFFGTLPSSPWAMLATSLHLRAPQKLLKNRTYNPF